MQNDKPLTEKQRRFVDAFMGAAKGNATEAARIAGYKGTPGALHVTATRTLSNAKVHAAIAERRKAEADTAIMDRQGLQQFFHTMASDDDKRPGDRLKAAELLGKMTGEFLNRLDVSGSVTAEVKAVMDESPAEVEDRVVEVFKADPGLLDRVLERVGGRAGWDSTEGGG